MVAVLEHVGASIRADLQIVWSVVQFIFIYVMDLLTTHDGAADFSFSHDNVLKDISLAVCSWMVRAKNLAIALLDNRAGSVEPTRARPTAEFRYSCAMCGNRETVPAVGADQRHRSGRANLSRPCVDELSHVMDAAQSSTKVNGWTDRAETLRAGRLALPVEGLTSLPSAVARRRAKGPFHLRIEAGPNYFAFTKGAMRHAYILTQYDGNHFAIKHGGRK